MTASAPLRVAREATGGVVAVAGGGGVGGGDGSRPVLGMHSRPLGMGEAGCVDSRVGGQAAGKLRVLARCRVPYWQAALPWRTEESRVTAGLGNGRR